MANSNYIDSTIITQTRDCEPISAKEFEIIRDTLTPHSFTVTDLGDQLVVETPYPFAEDKSWSDRAWQCCYLFKENGQWTWMTAAKRWWLLFCIGDPDSRYELLLRLIDDALQAIDEEVAP